MKTEWKYLGHRLRAAALYWLVIPGAVLGGGFAVDALCGFDRWPRRTWLEIAATGFLAIGGWFMYRAERDLADLGGGTPSPARPAKKLVDSGIYRLCRHPMFFGYDLAALGVVVFSRSSSALWIAMPFFLVWQMLFLNREEKLLAKRFGKGFSSYRKRTPFLLPFPSGQGKSRE